MIKFATLVIRNPKIQRAQYMQSTRKIFSKNHEDFINSLRESYKSLADNIQSPNSVLNLFNQKKEESTQKRNATQEEQLAEYLNVLNSSFAKYYANLSPEEQVKRSKDIIRSEALKKDWDTFAKVNRDYQDYSLFDKNLLAIKYSHNDADKSEGKYKQENNFFGDLDENVKERVERENVFSYIYENPNKSQRPDKEQNSIRRKFPLPRRRRTRQKLLAQLNPKATEEHKWFIKPKDLSKKRRVKKRGPKLSFRAKFELFNLFNEGWSVRDLSLRYGIMPYRVKAVVYQKRYFFDEVLPNISFDYLRELIAIEHLYERMYGAVDYGVDLEVMRRSEQGYLQTNFKTPNRNVDIGKLSEEEQIRIQNFFEKKKSKKQDIVTERFIGQGNKGYYLKSWILYKTRSKHGVSKMFERVIKDSDKPYKLPLTVQARLQQGPRLAGAKFGHK